MVVAAFDIDLVGNTVFYPCCPEFGMEHIDDLQAKLQEECGFVLPRFCYCQDYQYFVVDKTVDYAVALVGVVNKN